MEIKQINCSNCSKLVPHTNFCGECASKLPIVANCPICLNTVSLETTPCGHNVCNSCVPKLKKNGNTCPICRKSLGSWMKEDKNSVDDRHLNTISYTNTTTSQDNIINIINSHPLFLCPHCNSQDTYYCQREGSSCRNCKQYFRDFLRISEEQLFRYPVLDKEDVNPTMVKVCALCFSDRYEYIGPQWDMSTNCLNCKVSNINTITMSKRERQQHLIIDL